SEDTGQKTNFFEDTPCLPYRYSRLATDDPIAAAGSGSAARPAMAQRRRRIFPKRAQILAGEAAGVGEPVPRRDIGDRFRAVRTHDRLVGELEPDAPQGLRGRRAAEAMERELQGPHAAAGHTRDGLDGEWLFGLAAHELFSAPHRRRGRRSV